MKYFSKRFTCLSTWNGLGISPEMDLREGRTSTIAPPKCFFGLEGPPYHSAAINPFIHLETALNSFLPQQIGYKMKNPFDTKYILCFFISQLTLSIYSK